MSQQLTSLGSISAISLFVEDVPAAKAFYEDVFGVETVFEDDTSACVRFDGLFVNLELARDGYADLLTFPPNIAHVDDFTAAVREARDAGRGLWGAC